jgi:hypothetical protein
MFSFNKSLQYFFLPPRLGDLDPLYRLRAVVYRLRAVVNLAVPPIHHLHLVVVFSILDALPGWGKVAHVTVRPPLHAMQPVLVLVLEASSCASAACLARSSRTGVGVKKEGRPACLTD